MALKYVKIDTLALDSVQVVNDIINGVSSNLSFITPEGFNNITSFDPTKHLYLNKENLSIVIFTGDILFDDLRDIREVSHHYRSDPRSKQFYCYLNNGKSTHVRINRQFALESYKNNIPILKIHARDRPTRIEGIDKQYFTIGSKSSEILFKNNPDKIEYDFSIRLGRTDQQEPDLYQYSVNVSPNIIPENSIILKWVNRVPKIIVPTF